MNFPLRLSSENPQISRNISRHLLEISKKPHSYSTRARPLRHVVQLWELFTAACVSLQHIHKSGDAILAKHRLHASYSVYFEHENCFDRRRTVRLRYDTTVRREVGWPNGGLESERKSKHPQISSKASGNFRESGFLKNHQISFLLSRNYRLGQIITAEHGPRSTQITQKSQYDKHPGLEARFNN